MRVRATAHDLVILRVPFSEDLLPSVALSAKPDVDRVVGVPLALRGILHLVVDDDQSQVDASNQSLIGTFTENIVSN